MEARLVRVAPRSFDTKVWLLATMNILIEFYCGMYSRGAQAVRREKTYKV